MRMVAETILFDSVINSTSTTGYYYETNSTGEIPFTLDELRDMYSDQLMNVNKPLTIVRSTTSLISILVSSKLLLLICESNKGLRAVDHRLIFGLCVADILFSLSTSTFNLIAPSATDYMTWNARGNIGTCLAQGTFYWFGITMSSFYNMSLNIYYLFVIKFEKSEEYITQKVEPFLHAGPILTASIFTTIIYTNDLINPNGSGTCLSPANLLPHCIGYKPGEIRDGFEFPCYNGIQNLKTWMILFFIDNLVPFTVSILCLIWIYRFIVYTEKQMAKFDFASMIRARVQRRESIQGGAIIQQQKSVLQKILSCNLKSLCCAGWRRIRNITSIASSNSSSGLSEKRILLYKAIGFFLCYILIWFWPLIIFTREFLLKKEKNYVLYYLHNIFVPMQGLYNLVIFITPKVIYCMKRHNSSVSQSVRMVLSLQDEVLTDARITRRRSSLVNPLRGTISNDMMSNMRSRTMKKMASLRKNETRKKSPNQETKILVDLKDEGGGQSGGSNGSGRARGENQIDEEENGLKILLPEEDETDGYEDTAGNSLVIIQPGQQGEIRLQHEQDEELLKMLGLSVHDVINQQYHDDQPPPGEGTENFEKNRSHNTSIVHKNDCSELGAGSSNYETNKKSLMFQETDHNNDQQYDIDNRDSDLMFPMNENC